MSKSEIVQIASEETNLSKKDTAAAFDGFTAAITKLLEQNGNVTIPGIGTLKLSPQAERKGRNPSTGEEMTIAATTKVKFSASTTLKNRFK